MTIQDTWSSSNSAIQQRAGCSTTKTTDRLSPKSIYYHISCATVIRYGCIQIHTGPVVRIEPRGPWINVLDDGFNLHLRTDLVASAWVVRKPTVDGDVTSVEIYDATGEMMVQFFGERKPGQTERDDWRQLIAEGVLGQGVAA